jgi:hypothetical protein
MRLGGKDEDDDDDDAKTLKKLNEKLRSSVFILAIGTFQDFFDAPPKYSLGFGATTQKPPELDASEIANRLPRELTNRFHGSVIVLPDLTAENYREIALQAAQSIPEDIREFFIAAAMKRIDSSVAAKKGVRFVEEALLDTLVATRKTKSSPDLECGI